MPKLVTPNRELPFDQRRELFTKEVNTSGDKYLVGLEAAISVKHDGILPVLIVMDRKEAPLNPVNKPTKTK
ncbi:hypothetical protein LCGC14_1836180 [marine sediment metagenome]|uniref:Uncharacterized protein n=1 Tax=marine sediment metagenome TaxID=412755 RepID=A0A0F9JE71_9ZZZZ